MLAPPALGLRALAVAEPRPQVLEGGPLPRPALVAAHERIGEPAPARRTPSARDVAVRSARPRRRGSAAGCASGGSTGSRGWRRSGATGRGRVQRAQGDHLTAPARDPLADGADVGEVADAPAPRRAGGRHLHGHAPLPQTRRGGGSGRARRAGSSRRRRRRERARGGRAEGRAGAARTSPRSVPSSRRRSHGASQRLRGARAHDPDRPPVRARPWRPGWPRWSPAAACASGPRRRTSRRRCPTRRWSGHPSGPFPRRSSTKSCSASASAASQVRL